MSWKRAILSNMDIVPVLRLTPFPSWEAVLLLPPKFEQGCLVNLSKGSWSTEGALLRVEVELQRHHGRRRPPNLPTWALGHILYFLCY
jgi:hypothetical protein